MNSTVETEYLWLAGIAAQQDAARREDDHGPALLMNAEFDERVRLQALADQAVADTHAPAPTLEALTDDIADEPCPTDMEIIGVLADAFYFTPKEVIERLSCMDFVTLRREIVA